MGVYPADFDPTSSAAGPFRWVFPARSQRIVDGDTVDLELDLGFGTHLHEQRFRLLGVDTAEIYGTSHDSEEYALGIEQTQFVLSWMDQATSGAEDLAFPLRVVTLPAGTAPATGKYGRYLAVLYRTADGSCLQTELLAEFPEAASPTEDCPHPSTLGGQCQWCGFSQQIED